LIYIVYLALFCYVLLDVTLITWPLYHFKIFKNTLSVFFVPLDSCIVRVRAPLVLFIFFANYEYLIYISFLFVIHTLQC